MTKRFIIGLVLMTAVLVPACRITSVWKAPGAQRPKPSPTRLSENPFKLVPERLTVPAGAVARFNVLSTETLPDTSFEWSIEGLPSGARAEFFTGTGYPGDGVLLIRTAGTETLGVSSLTVGLSTDEHEWSGKIALELIPCKESAQAGSFVTQTRVAKLAGGPSTLSYGNGSTILTFCESATARVLTVRVLSATNEQGEVWTGTGATLTLYRLLDWPPPDEITEIVTDNRDDRNVESVATAEDDVVTWDITPGTYFVYFPQDQFREGASEMGEFSPDISVTYRIQVEPAP
jgi:hypothetical protein